MRLFIFFIFALFFGSCQKETYLIPGQYYDSGGDGGTITIMTSGHIRYARPGVIEYHMATWEPIDDYSILVHVDTSKCPEVWYFEWIAEDVVMIAKRIDSMHNDPERPGVTKVNHTKYIRL